MGVRESLLNTITSVADSDFVRVVTAAGASSKATVRNLFKGFESNLGAKSSLTTSDYIRVVGSDNEPYKQGISSVKSAMGVDALNSKVEGIASTQALILSNGATDSVSVNNLSRGLIIVSGGNNAAKGLYIFNATSTGALSFVTVQESTGVSVTSSANNTISFSNTSNYSVKALVVSY